MAPFLEMGGQRAPSSWLCLPGVECLGEHFPSTELERVVKGGSKATDSKATDS